jgi:hypothetical protein
LSAGCGEGLPDSLLLGDKIAASAARLRREGGSRAVVEYDLTIDSATVVAFVPLGGRVDWARLPAGVSTAQEGRLKEAATMWSDRQALIVAWDAGLGAGPVDDRQFTIRDQFIVVKAARERVFVVLQKDSAGDVTIVEVR